MTLNGDIEQGIHVRQHRYRRNGRAQCSVQVRSVDRSISVFRWFDSVDDAWAVGVAALATLRANH